jgi:RNA polymerase sigma-70 factor, ECF subfamily
MNRSSRGDVTTDVEGPAPCDAHPTGVLDAARLHQVQSRFRTPLISYVSRLTGDHQLAEKVTQDVLLRAWSHPQALATDPEEMSGWLFTVARHRTIDALRSRGRRIQPGPFDVDAADHDDPVDAGDAVLDRLVVLDALSELSAEHRDVLAHTYYLGHTVRETA